jgi:hypothetical protein
MADVIQRYNDGSGDPPRLRLSHSLWGLSRLPLDGKEWSLSEKCRRVKEAGFEALECWLTDENEREVRDALEAADLRLALGHHPFTLEDTRKTVERARRLDADYIFGQPADAFTPDEQAFALVRDGRKLASDAGVPYFIESHRNTITETLPATYRLIEGVPDVRFTADLSHYFVVGEFYGWPEERLPERLGPILERTSSIHGRVSNGEAVQVDVGDGSGRAAQTAKEMWRLAMVAFLRDARPGDVMPFTPELGPPSYAITLPDGREFSDRWEQSLVLTRLAQEAWAEAQAAVGG